MARSFTNTTENDVLNGLFGTPSYTAHPANLVLRLSTTLPTDAGVITEPSGGAYVEQPITFGAASSGVVANTNTITFPVATAPWGKIVGWAVRDTVAPLTIATGYMGTFHDWALRSSAAADEIIDGGALAPADGTRVLFSVLNPDGSFIGDVGPIGLDDFENDLAEYFVVNSGSTGGFGFQVALTPGGTPLDIIGSAGNGAIGIWLSKLATVGIGDQLVFAPGAITISLK